MFFTYLESPMADDYQERLAVIVFYRTIKENL